MCGIAGYYIHDSGALPTGRELLARMNAAMARRGPDGEGLWISPSGDAGLAHRRLAVIDLTVGGDQPMTSADGRYRITFNGEIYNYKALRIALKAAGRDFRSNSDTEVLLHLYDERGPEMVRDLRGMFAFAIHDAKDRTLFLARDPFGIKPLYYADDGKSVRFASQVKALMAGGDVSTRPSAAGHVAFYLWGHLPDPYTLYDGIRALEAGTTLLLDASGRRVTRKYFGIADEYTRGEAPRVTVDEALDRFHAALRDSVRHHLVADVPVGVFLSAGLDSATLTALAAEERGGDLLAITLGFDDYRGTGEDETALAAVVARQYGVAHRTQWVSRTDFEAQMEGLLAAMDQPSIDGVNTYFVSRAAAGAGLKMAISGIGGDELLRGYPSFRDVPLMAALLAPFATVPALGRGFRRVSAPLIRRMMSPKYAGLLEYGGSHAGAYLLRRGLFMPWELPDFLDGELVREGWGELQTLVRLNDTIAGVDSSAGKVSALEMSWYLRNQLLRDADWAGMAHSLEIRTPLVDVELFRSVVTLGRVQPLHKQAMAGAPDLPLPRLVLEREKTGFAVPLHVWLCASGEVRQTSNAQRAWAQMLLPPPNCASASLQA